MDAQEQYRVHIDEFKDFCEEFRRIISVLIDDKNIRTHDISGRVKSFESFCAKALRKNADGSFKYTDPISQITDVSGVRVIAYTLSDVASVCNVIEEEFDVLERKDIGDDRFREGRFGYQSIHYLVRFGEGRTRLPEYAKYLSRICEVQVRTVLQHSWAELEHDIQYKRQSDIPRSIARKFTALAGLIEIADREFDGIKASDVRIRNIITVELQDEITRDHIKKRNQEAGPSSDDVSVPVRLLVKRGEFGEAKKVYDAKISESPSMYTLYIGRARVLFLLGDSSGALADVAEALKLSPGNEIALRLERQIRDGTVEVSNYLNKIDDNVKIADQYMNEGNGVGAYEYYSIAQSNGYNAAFSIINKAMACCLAGDFEGSSVILKNIKIIPGTPMSVVIMALYCMIYKCINDVGYEEEKNKLLFSLRNDVEFRFENSPLVKLEKGVEAVASDLLTEHKEAILEVLRMVREFSV